MISVKYNINEEDLSETKTFDEYTFQSLFLFYETF